ncbi:MAG: ATP-dependent RNA helicase SrmB [Nitrosomonadaceae bacterium]|nr:ATP-dependent RNA helicase SrmB [Nitrosomonadaceae bacterium]
MNLSEYEWPRPHGFEPFDHQKVTSEFLISNRKAFCFNEQGTGKTASVIWAVDYLMSIRAVKRVLVVCPLSIMRAAWQADLFKFAIHRTVAIAYGSAAKRKEIVNSNAEFVVINYDGVAIVRKELLAGGFDLIVVDEASAYKNAQTDRWKALRDLNKVIKGLWMLTGTPAAQSPADAYGLAKLVNPTAVSPFFGQFKDTVMNKVSLYRWVPKPSAQATVHKILQPAIRFEKAQCLDLPPVTFVDRDAPLSAQQQKFYNILRKQMLIEAAGEEITAVNAAVQVSKLLQIACGSVYTDNREVIEFDVSNRLNVVQEIIDETSNKVLVFVPFTHTIDLLKKHLEKQHITCAVINGAVSLNQRSDIVRSFQELPTIKVLIIQPQAASHGLTLTAADTIIWYAPCTSVETYLQANARIDRPGQKNNMTIVHISGSPVEAKVYSLLRNNIGNHQKIIDLYRQEISSEII